MSCSLHMFGCNGQHAHLSFYRSMETVKGDMYIRDMKNTAGHVGPLTSACWDPKNPSRFLTSSYDSTLRIWDINERSKSLKTIVVKSKDRGARTKLTKATFSEDGKTIAAAGIDGTIHLWSTSSNFARPNSVSLATFESKPQCAYASRKLNVICAADY